MYEQVDIENTLRRMDPQVEVLLVERLGPRSNQTIRIVIDSPEGVDHDLCGRVTEALSGIRENFNLEVSSPGIERPLTKPEHFKGCIGERIGVRTKDPINGRRNFKGVLVGIEKGDITLDCGDTQAIIPERDIKKSRLLKRGGGTRQ